MPMPSSGRTIKAVSLGHSNCFHVLFTDGAQLWHNLSAILRSNLRGKGRDLPPPRFVSLGPSGRWFVGYEGGRHRWGNGPPSFDRLLLRAFRLIEFVSFGPGDSWFVRFQDGGFAYDGLPRSLMENIDAKLENQVGNTIKRIVLGPSGEWWILFDDGTALFAVRDPDLTYILEKSNVRELSIGVDGSYVALGDFGMAWNNLGPEFEEVRKYIQKGGSEKEDSAKRPDPGYEPDREEESDVERVEDQGPRQKQTKFTDDHRVIEYPATESEDETEPYLDPSKIRYTKVSIKSMLRNGSGSIYDLAEGLIEGNIIPEEAPRIRVVRQPGNEFWTLDNRWLWAFNRASLNLIPVRFVDADEEFFRRRAVVGDGWNVAIID